MSIWLIIGLIALAGVVAIGVALYRDRGHWL